jgi:hypothetical protein
MTSMCCLVLSDVSDGSLKRRDGRMGAAAPAAAEPNYFE